MKTLHQRLLDALDLVKAQYGPAEALPMEVVELTPEQLVQRGPFTARINNGLSDIARVHLNPYADEWQMKSDMLHESVHVLNPPPLNSDYVSCLEEAAAIYLSHHPKIHGAAGWTCYQLKRLREDTNPDRKCYGDALKALETLTADVVGLVRTVRGNGRSLSSLDSGELLELSKGINLSENAEQLAIDLCKAFERPKASSQ